MPDLAELELRIESTQAQTADTRLLKLERSARQLESQAIRTSKSTQRLNTQFLGTSRYARDAARHIKFLTGGFLALRTIDNTVRSMATFEKGLDSVAKTTSLSEAELQRLGSSVVELGATFNPTPVETLLDIGRAAGQLGVDGVANIEAFTKTIGDVTLASDLTADAAATNLRRIQNVLGGQTSDIDRLGSTLIGLGNNFAATESEILAVSTRIAQTGSVFDITQADALALGAAFRALGVRSELAGAQTGRMFRRIEEASIEGGVKLDNFVRIVGGTADEFRALAQSNPTDALQAVLNGLAEINSQGGSTVRALQSINLASERSLQVFPALALGIDTVNSALDQGRRFWDENTAAQVEAARGSDNLIGDYGKLKNALQGLAIAAGDGGLLGFLRSTVQLFGDLARVALGLSPELERNARLFEALAFGIKTAATVAATFVTLKIGAFLVGIATSATAATGAMAGLTAVIAANPFGLAAIALGSLISAIAFLGDESNTSTRAIQGLNAATKELESSFSAVAAAQAGISNAVRTGDIQRETEATQRLADAYRQQQERITELAATSDTPTLSFDSLAQLDKEFEKAVNIDALKDVLRADFQRVLDDTVAGVALSEGDRVKFDQVFDFSVLPANLQSLQDITAEIERIQFIGSDSSGRFNSLQQLQTVLKDLKVLGVPAATALELLDGNIAKTEARLKELATTAKNLPQGPNAPTDLFNDEVDPERAATAERRIAKLREEQELRERLAVLSRDQADVEKKVADARALAATAGLDQDQTNALLQEVAASERLIQELERLRAERDDETKSKQEAREELEKLVRGLESERQAVGQSAQAKATAEAVEKALTLARQAGLTQTDLIIAKVTNEVQARFILKDALTEEERATKALEKAQAELLKNRQSDGKYLTSLRDEITQLKLSNLEAAQYANLRQLSADATDEQKAAVIGLTRELNQMEKARNLADGLGNAFGNAMDRLATGAADGREALRDLIGSFNREVLNAVAIAPITERLKQAFLPAAEVLTKAGSTLNPNDGLDAGAQASQAALAEALTAAASASGTTLTTAATTSGTTLTTAATTSGTTLTTTSTTAAATLTGGGQAAGAALIAAAEVAAARLASAKAAIGNGGDVADSLANGGEAAANALQRGVDESANSLRQGISDSTRAASQAVSNVAGGLAGGLVNSAQSIAGASEGLASTAGGALQGIGSALTSAVSSTGSTLANAGATAASTLAGGVSAAAAALVAAAAKAAALLAISSGVSAGTGIFGGGTLAGGSLGPGAGPGGSLIGGLPTNFFATGGVSGTAKEAPKSGKKIKAFATGGVSAAAARVTRQVVESVQRVGQIPALSNGGVRQGLVTQPTLMSMPGGPALVGEGMYAEAVMQAHNMGGNQMGVPAVIRKSDGQGGIRTVSTLATLKKGGNGVMGVQIDAFASGGVSGRAPSQAPLSGLERVLVESAAARQAENQPIDRERAQSEAPNKSLRSNQPVQPGSSSTSINNTRNVFQIRGDRDTSRFNRKQINRDVSRADRRPSY